MLVLKLERWPQGDRKRAEDLGMLEISNDCTSPSVDIGNYDAVLRAPGSSERHRRIVNFERGPSAERAWLLAKEALKALFFTGP